MGKQTLRARIPDRADWAGYDADLDVRDLHKLIFGKSHAELAKHLTNGRAIERMDELLFAPRRVFQYYVHGFVDYLTSETAKGDADAASAFLSLPEAREERDAGSVAAIYPELAQCIEFVAAHQDHFDAEASIYGHFSERAARIREACSG